PPPRARRRLCGFCPPPQLPAPPGPLPPPADRRSRYRATARLAPELGRSSAKLHIHSPFRDRQLVAGLALGRVAGPAPWPSDRPVLGLACRRRRGSGSQRHPGLPLALSRLAARPHLASRPADLVPRPLDCLAHLRLADRRVAVVDAPRRHRRLAASVCPAAGA